MDLEWVKGLSKVRIEVGSGVDGVGPRGTG